MTRSAAETTPFPDCLVLKTLGVRQVSGER